MQSWLCDINPFVMRRREVEKVTDNQRLLAYLRDHQDDMVASLTQVVEMESPTYDKPSLD